LNKKQQKRVTYYFSTHGTDFLGFEDAGLSLFGLLGPGADPPFRKACMSERKWVVVVLLFY
jgi:hypothetical protein